jgi:hypothetical protein
MCDFFVQASSCLAVNQWEQQFRKICFSIIEMSFHASSAISASIQRASYHDKYNNTGM